MANPQIIPPPPTITQPSTPGSDDSPGMEAVQAAFDKVLPAIKSRPSTAKAAEPPKEPVAPPQKTETPPPEVAPPDTQQPPPDTSKEPSKESHEIPSFLEEALRGEPSQAQPSTEDEWPEELPAFKTPEESKARYKKWRESYSRVKSELQTLREKPTLNAEQMGRLEYLEGQNKQMTEILSRVGVEHSVEFQNNILRPLHTAWNDAVRIVRDAGGDPQALAKAMTLNGKAQFEALDNLFEEMPESAKLEAHDALRTYRRFEDARKAAIANAPAALEGIRKRETERQYQVLQQQREEMKNLFDSALTKLRDEAKLEVLLKTDTPDGQWWNEQGDNIVKQARELYLENTDLNRVAMACLLAPTADVYRKLFLRSQKKVGELQKLINERISSEPNLTERGGPGNMQTPDAQLKDDLNRPFSEVFLREFHKAQARNR